jgi:RTC4-like domain
LLKNQCAANSTIDSYGEKGGFIIMKMLKQMFQEDNEAEGSHAPGPDRELIKPLSHLEFLELVMVPETAVLLIAADLNIEPELAVETWQNSSQYGRCTFPASDDDNQQMVSTGKGKRKG